MCQRSDDVALVKLLKKGRTWTFAEWKWNKKEMESDDKKGERAGTVARETGESRMGGGVEEEEGGGGGEWASGAVTSGSCCPTMSHRSHRRCLDIDSRRNHRTGGKHCPGIHSLSCGTLVTIASSPPQVSPAPLFLPIICISLGRTVVSLRRRCESRIKVWWAVNVAVIRAA